MIRFKQNAEPEDKKPAAKAATAAPAAPVALDEMGAATAVPKPKPKTKGKKKEEDADEANTTGAAPKLPF